MELTKEPAHEMVFSVQKVREELTEIWNRTNDKISIPDKRMKAAEARCNLLMEPDLNDNETKLTFVSAFCELKSKSKCSPFLPNIHKYKQVEPPEADMTTFFPSDINSEVVISLRFYKPLQIAYGVKYDRYRFAQEILVLGSTVLGELRKHIDCICENKRFFDVSNNPSAELPEKETDPAYFFITDTFYNDYKRNNGEDYTECERNWMNTQLGSQNKTIVCKDMNETKFSDLMLAFQKPYLYLHHGNCQHTFCVSDITLLGKGDPCIARNQYPHTRSVGASRLHACYTCNGQNNANFVVLNNMRLIKTPTYMCSGCFIKYNYIDGKKIGDFKAYRLCDYYRMGEEEEDEDEDGDDISEQYLSNEEDSENNESDDIDDNVDLRNNCDSIQVKINNPNDVE